MPNVLIDGLKERISNAISINQSIGILLPGSNYQDLIQAIFERAREKPDEAWVFVSVTKPFQTLSQQFDYIKDMNNIRFIDCISRAAGISEKQKNVTFIESPTMLEKIGLEIMNTFKEVDPKIKKFLVIDSITLSLIHI